MKNWFPLVSKNFEPTTDIVGRATAKLKREKRSTALCSVPEDPISMAKVKDEKEFER
jgi:hypothetical protein